VLTINSLFFFYRDNPLYAILLFIAVPIFYSIWRIFIEWKYIKETREYLITIFTIIYLIGASFTLYGFVIS
jgi:hypothetical protein